MCARRDHTIRTSKKIKRIDKNEFQLTGLQIIKPNNKIIS